MKKPRIFYWRGHKWLMRCDAREGDDNPSERYLAARAFINLLNTK